MKSKTKVKIAPHSKESEMMVLGCMLTSVNSLSVAADALVADDFYYTEHQLLFQVLKNNYTQDKPADVHLICEELQRIDKLETVGGVGYVTTLAQYAGTSAYIEEYAEIIKAKSILRRIIQRAQIIEKEALDDPQDVAALLDFCQGGFKNLEDDYARSSTYYCKFRNLLEPRLENDISKEIQNTSLGTDVGYKIGQIEVKIPGGAITIVAGPTGHGKTATLINFGLGALNSNPSKKIYFFSYEESEAAITTLFLNTYINKQISENNRKSIKSFFRDGDVQYMNQLGRKCFETEKDKFFNDLITTRRLNIRYSEYYAEDLVSAIKFLKENDKDIELICVDYIQLLATKTKSSNSRQEEIKHICLMLKNCAVETGLPILVAAQFNRTVSNITELSPIAIGEAGDIERIASMIIGFWNMNYEGIGTNGRGVLKQTKPEIYFKILKGREVGIGHNTRMDFDGNTGKLTNKPPGAPLDIKDLLLESKEPSKSKNEREQPQSTHNLLEAVMKR